MTPDVEKARRENLRWIILLALNSAQPVGTSEAVVLSAIQPMLPDITPLELRRNLDYLEERNLITITGRNTQPHWFCKLDRFGIDIVEYTVPCDAGIARPVKYW
ncbi:MAG: hypothetical protein AUK53_11895 [Betaproteobacteria bacterium CG2_30_59_46]|nr:MAG: hypothetical protein AUK53_11895 [Betaproteobacteria bacterium CG2_30_59_46]